MAIRKGKREMGCLFVKGMRVVMEKNMKIIMRNTKNEEKEWVCSVYLWSSLLTDRVRLKLENRFILSYFLQQNLNLVALCSQGCARLDVFPNCAWGHLQEVM